jgi:hypothetical protein
LPSLACDDYDFYLLELMLVMTLLDEELSGGE